MLDNLVAKHGTHKLKLTLPKNNKFINKET